MITPITNQVIPKVMAWISSCVSKVSTTKTPINGATTQASELRCPPARRRRDESTSTATCTMANEINAPKLMNDVDVVTHIPNALSLTTPPATIATTGVANFGASLANTFGMTLSRPITYSRRVPAVCAAIPEVNCAMTSAAMKTAAKAAPPIRVAISKPAVSTLLNTPPGCTSCTAYETRMKIPPPIKAISIMALGTVFRGSIVSSDMVVTASKPRNAYAATAAPATTGVNS